MNTPRRIGGRAPCTRLNSTRGVSRRFLLPSAAVLGVLAAVASPNPVLAQETAAPAAPAAATQGTGSIAGKVSDAGTEKFLEGAEIVLVGTSEKTTASRDGSFKFSGVPAGEQTLLVNYIGMEQKKVAVTVAPGETARADIKLSSDIVILDDFVVTGTREGTAQALVLQKISVQTKIVAAGDQFGPVSEGNVGEYLKFLPGVTIDYNVNDARGVSLRGLSSAFTTITVDGTPVASGSSNSLTRRFELEQVASNNIETYEIYKTVTPDLPATATGGFVNAITKSAFDHDEVQRISYDLSFGGPSTNYNLSTKASGVWTNSSHYTVRPNLDLNISRKITDKVGLNISYRYSDKYDDAPRLISTYSLTSGSPVLTQFDVADEQKLTHRESLAGRFDFKFTEDTKLSVDASWYNYDLIFTQRYLRYKLSSATMDGDTATATGNSSTVSNNVLQRRKYGDTFHYSATLEHKFGDESVLKLTPYYSVADAYYADTEYGYLSGGATYTLAKTTATTGYNRITISGLDDLSTAPTIVLDNLLSGDVAADSFLRTLSNYTLQNKSTTETTSWGSNLQSRPWHARDIKDGINGSYARDLFTGAVPVKLEVGFAYDEAYRMMKNYDYRGYAAAITGTTLSALRDVQYSNDIAFGSGTAQFLDPYKLYDSYSSLLSLSSLDIYRFEEENSAGYARFDITPFKDFLIVTGVRWEQREIDALTQRWAAKGYKSGSTYVPYTTYTTGSNNLKYDNWYPSLLLKYTPRKWLVVRGGVSRTVGNPDYGDLVTSVQNESIVGSDGSVTYSSKGLKPYFVTNYDLGADYYLGNTGVFGLSLFYKQMDNYISSYTSLTDDQKNAIADELGLDDISDYSSWSITKNGGKADFKGFEVSYAQNFTFLPKPFNGLNLQMNYTYTDISSSDWDTEHSLKRGIAPQTFNLILGYRYGRFNATITNNWTDESLYSGYVGTTWSSNGFYYMKDDRWQTDVKLEYSLSKYVSFYVSVRNIFNTARDEFLQGNTKETENIRVPYRYGEFGEPYYTFGFRGTF